MVLGVHWFFPVLLSRACVTHRGSTGKLLVLWVFVWLPLLLRRGRAFKALFGSVVTVAGVVTLMGVVVVVVFVVVLGRLLMFRWFSLFI